MKENKKRIRLTYDLIIKAVHGDKGALEDVLIYFDSYITALSTFYVVDKKGEKTRRVDLDVKAEIQTKFIIAIQKWKAVL